MQPELESFCHSLKNVHPILYEKYVAGFAAQCVNTEGIKLQKEQVLALDRQVRELERVMRKSSLPCLNELLKPENRIHRDLIHQIELYLTTSFAHLLPKEPIVNPEVISQFFDDQVKKINDLLSVAYKRNAEIKEVEFFKKDFLKLIAPIEWFKDLQPLKEKLQAELQPLASAMQKIIDAPISEVSKAFNDYIAIYKGLTSHVVEVSRTLRSEFLHLELIALDAKRTIRRRLFEVFTGISPYNDLKPLFTDVRKNVSTKLEQLTDSFYAGHITTEEFNSACLDMAYEHDVTMIRNEISHRSSRLKDLRDECYVLYKELQHSRRFFELDKTTSMSKISREFLFVTRSLCLLLLEIEDPFKTFKGASNKDEVNYVFRMLWMKIEELQPKIGSLREEANQAIVSHIHLVKEAFFKAVDTVEEAVRTVEGVRPQLVIELRKTIVENEPNALLVQIEKEIAILEKRYPFIQPFSFYMSIDNSRECLKLLLQAKQQQVQFDDLHTFSKAMQYMKTFEEERIDTILEAFESAYLIVEEQSTSKAQQEAFLIYQKKMSNAFLLVLEEVLLDIGLLDMHALMDVDQEKLKKILRFAIARAKKLQSHLNDLFCELERVNGHDELYKEGILYLKNHLAEWSEKQIQKEEPVINQLEYLRFFCHDLFDAKLLRANKAKNKIAGYLELLFQLWILATRVEEFLMDVREKKAGFWGTPWIVECHEIRHCIVRFEPGSYQADELKPLIDKVFKLIYRIQEINELQLKHEDPLQLQKIQGELQNELALLHALPKEIQDAPPFFYLPGYIRFFSNES